MLCGACVSFLIRSLLELEGGLNVTRHSADPVSNELLEQIELRIEESLENRVLHSVTTCAIALA